MNTPPNDPLALVVEALREARTAHSYLDGYTVETAARELLAKLAAMLRPQNAGDCQAAYDGPDRIELLP